MEEYVVARTDRGRVTVVFLKGVTGQYIHRIILPDTQPDISAHTFT